MPYILRVARRTPRSKPARYVRPVVETPPEPEAEPVEEPEPEEPTPEDEADG